MNIKQLFHDEDAVSPVIGVILMVAITVILAAVIGTFVLGLGDQVQSSAPNANFQFEYSAAAGTNGFADNSDDGDTFDVIHNGGQDIDRSNLAIQVGDDEYSPIQTSTSGVTSAFSDPVSTGSSATLDEADAGAAFEAGEDVLVIWTSPNGDSSNTIGSSTVPS